MSKGFLGGYNQHFPYDARAFICFPVHNVTFVQLKPIHQTAILSGKKLRMIPNTTYNYNPYDT